MKLPTVKIRVGESYNIINESDFDAKIHVPWNPLVATDPSEMFVTDITHATIDGVPVLVDPSMESTVRILDEPPKRKRGRPKKV